MWFNDLQHEAGRHAGIECVATSLEHRHAGSGAEPVGRGDDAEGTENFRPCREHKSNPG